MAKETIKVTSLVPAMPHDVYEAWLDSVLHARMTGGAASIEKSVGGHHSAWDGYIEGKNLELEPGRRIVQSWRTSDFPADAGDSTIEIRLEAEDGRTRITIRHFDIPEGQGKGYESGWRDHYFRPMHEYFSDLAADDAEPVTEAMPVAVVHAMYAPASAPASDEAPTVKLIRPATKAAPKSPAKKVASPKRPAAKKLAATKPAAPPKPEEAQDREAREGSQGRQAPGRQKNRAQNDEEGGQGEGGSPKRRR